MDLIEARSLPIENVLRKKPYPRPEAWVKPSNIEHLSIEEKVDELVLDLAFAATPPLRAMIDMGFGRERQGEVLGREGEDTQIGIDSLAETLERKILIQSAKKHGLSLFVFSEHNHFKVGGDEPDIIASDDPIDNSGEYEAGLNTPPYIAAGFFNRKGMPIAGVVSNLLTGHIYINRGGKNYEYNPNIKRLTGLPPPKKIESIKDPEFCLVSYDGKYKYTGPFRANFDRLDEERNQNRVFHGKAGSHQYGEGIARGSISAYIMFGEPISELLQGLAFARDAGYIVANVNPEDGTWEEYKFDTNFYLKNPDRYNIDRIPLLIVANSKPLLYELIYYGFAKPFPGWENI